MDISPQKIFGGYKAHEKILTLLIIKEIKSKTTRVSHLTQPSGLCPEVWLQNGREDVETWEVSYTDAGNVSC